MGEVDGSSVGERLGEGEGSNVGASTTDTTGVPTYVTVTGDEATVLSSVVSELIRSG